MCNSGASRESGLVLNYELLVWSTVSAASLSSGALQHLWGWAVVNVAVIPMMLFTLAATAWLRSRRAQVYA